MANVILKPHTGINIATKKVQCFEQYLVYEGHPDKPEWIGIKGWKPGDPLIFMTQVDPIRKEAIRAAVSKQMDEEAAIISKPDIDEDQVNPPTQENYDEFDESDLT